MPNWKPVESAWRHGQLHLQPGADGHHGVLTMDDIHVHIRRWRKDEAGVIRFECQHESDGWVERTFGV